jgi:hypothetical protein
MGKGAQQGALKAEFGPPAVNQVWRWSASAEWQAHGSQNQCRANPRLNSWEAVGAEEGPGEAAHLTPFGSKPVVPPR